MAQRRAKPKPAKPKPAKAATAKPTKPTKPAGGHGGRRRGAGRKSKGHELGIKKKLEGGALDDMPDLGDGTEATVIKYLALLAVKVQTGQLDTVTAKALREIATDIRRTTGQQREDEEMAELREMVTRAESVAARGAEHEALDRQHLADADADQRQAQAQGPDPQAAQSGAAVRADVGVLENLAQGQPER